MSDDGKHDPLLAPAKATLHVGDATAPAQMPFYYASLSNLWVYFRVDPEVAKEYVKDTGFKLKRFADHAVAVINFQNYTGHGGVMLETVNEVEFNLLVYPKARKEDTPLELPFEAYLAGEDQTKNIGNLRIHVPADNEFAVAAGKAFFGEPKFYATFTYDVPSGNNPGQRVWEMSCNDGENDLIFSLYADVCGVPSTSSNLSPIVEFGVLDGRPLGSLWQILGDFRTHRPLPGGAVKVTVGDSVVPMAKDMAKILGPVPAPIAVQVFQSAPVAVEPRAYYVDVS